MNANALLFAVSVRLPALLPMPLRLEPYRFCCSNIRKGACNACSSPTACATASSDFRGQDSQPCCCTAAGAVAAAATASAPFLSQHAMHVGRQLPFQLKATSGERIIDNVAAPVPMLLPLLLQGC